MPNYSISTRASTSSIRILITIDRDSIPELYQFQYFRVDIRKTSEQTSDAWVNTTVTVSQRNVQIELSSRGHGSGSLQPGYVEPETSYYVHVRYAVNATEYESTHYDLYYDVGELLGIATTPSASYTIYAKVNFNMPDGSVAPVTSATFDSPTPEGNVNINFPLPEKQGARFLYWKLDGSPAEYGAGLHSVLGSVDTYEYNAVAYWEEREWKTAQAYIYSSSQHRWIPARAFVCAGSTFVETEIKIP